MKWRVPPECPRSRGSGNEWNIDNYKLQIPNFKNDENVKNSQSPLTFMVW